MKNIIETTGEILDLVREFDLEEFELDTKDVRIRLSTVPPTMRVAAAPAPAVAAAPTTAPALAESAADDIDIDEYATIASPMVGTFYRRPAPDKPPYTDVGETVNTGQPVCIIEAMKLMNEIKSDIRGKIVKILVENEQPVQEGQVLFLIDPD